jgi:hypothetical protein
MPEEIGWLDIGGGWEVSEISQEQVDRVRENQWQARKVWAQIKHLQKQNSQYAKLLALLLQYIDDDQLLWYIFQQLVDDKVDPVIIFAQFLPIMERYIDVSRLEVVYKALRDTKNAYNHDVESVVNRFKTVRRHYTVLWKLDQDEYVWLILRWLQVEEIVDQQVLSEEQVMELKWLIMEKL